MSAYPPNPVLNDQRYPLGVGNIDDPMEPYFGPAKRPLYVPADWDLERDSMTLAQAHDGYSERLSALFIGLLKKDNFIMTAANGVFPKRHDKNTNFERIIWKFNKTLTDLAPDGAPPEFVTFEKETREFHSERRNIGVRVKHDWWKTQEGRDIFSKQLEIMRQAVDETMNQSGIRALINGKNAHREYARRYQEPVNSIEEALEWEKWRFGIVQTDPDGLGWLRLHAKLDKMMEQENIKPNLWLVPPGMKEYQAYVPPQSTQYYKGGKATYDNLEKGEANYDRFGGIRVEEIHDYIVDGERTLNSLKREREVGGYFVLADFSAGQKLGSYTNERRDTFVYDLSKDQLVKVTLDFAIRNSNRFDEQGQLTPEHEQIANNADGFMRNQNLKPYGPDGLVDMFLVRDDQSASGYRVASKWGELEPSALPDRALQYFGRIFEAKMREGVLSDNEATALERGLELIEMLSSFDSSDRFARAFIFAVANQNAAITLGDETNLAVLKKNALGGVEPPVAIEAGNGALYLGVQPEGADEALFVRSAPNTVSSFELTDEPPTAGNALSYVRAPITPFGYGNWVGMKTLARIASQPVGAPQRQLFTDEILATARGYVNAVEKMHRGAAGSFVDNAALDPNNAPFFFRTGKSGPDSVLNFAQNIVDGNKQPFFVSRESVQAGTRPEQEDEDEFVFETEERATQEDINATTDAIGFFFRNIESLAPRTQSAITNTENIARLISMYQEGPLGANYAKRKSPANTDNKFATFINQQMNAENARANINLLNWIVEQVARKQSPSMSAQYLTRVKRGEFARSSDIPRQPEAAYSATFGDAGDYVVSLLTANASAFSPGDEFIRPSHPDNPAAPIEPGQDLNQLLDAASIPVTSFFGSDGSGGAELDAYDFAPYGRQRKRRAPSSSAFGQLNNNMSERMRKIRDYKSSMSRYGAQLLALSPITLEQLLTWNRNDMLVPVEVIGSRPFRRFLMGSGVLIQTPVGFTPYDYEDFMLATDVSTKYTTGHFTIWHGTVIDYPDRFVLAEDIFFIRALGGYDTKPIAPENLNPADETFGGSVIYMLVPYGTYSNPEHPLPTTFDITGTYDPRQFGDDRLRQDADIEWDRSLYPSALYYSFLYNLSKLKWNINPMEASFLEVPHQHNTLVSQEFQRYVDPNTGEASKFIVERSHLGTNVYGGMREVLNGLPAYFKDMHYEQNEIPV